MQSGPTLFQRNENMESWFQSLGRLSLGLAFCKVSWQFFFLKFQFEVYNYLVLNPKILKATAEIKTCGWPLQNLKTQVSQSKCSVHSLGTEPQTCESTIWNQNLKIGHSTVFFSPRTNLKLKAVGAQFKDWEGTSSSKNLPADHSFS